MVVVNANAPVEVVVKVKMLTNVIVRKIILLVKVPEERDEENTVRNFRKHLNMIIVDLVSAVFIYSFVEFEFFVFVIFNFSSLGCSL